jgi:hypothetical protein
VEVIDAGCTGHAGRLRSPRPASNAVQILDRFTLPATIDAGSNAVQDLDRFTLRPSTPPTRPRAGRGPRSR